MEHKTSRDEVSTVAAYFDNIKSAPLRWGSAAHYCLVALSQMITCRSSQAISDPAIHFIIDGVTQ